MDIEKKNEAEQRFKSLGTKSKRITFPLLFWEEFEKDCKENYNDTYYLKIKADHDYRQSMGDLTRLVVQDLVNLQAEMAELREEMQSIREAILETDSPTEETEVQEEKKGFTTFG